VEREDEAERERLFAELSPELERKIRATFRGCRARVPRHVEEDDVVQEVLLRFTARPPGEKRAAGASASATLKAWLGRATVRHIIDRTRDRSSRAQSLSDGSDTAATHEPKDDAPGAHRRLASHQELDRIGRAVADRYPRGVAIFDMIREHGWLPSRQLARMTGDTPANVDQIRSRIRRIAASLSEEAPVKRPTRGSRS
jgi:DNA-directed RNA polymerase specialized sigma24 family protein